VKTEKVQTVIKPVQNTVKEEQPVKENTLPNTGNPNAQYRAVMIGFFLNHYRCRMVFVKA
jgi:hypothetical protein